MRNCEDLALGGSTKRKGARECTRSVVPRSRELQETENARANACARSTTTGARGQHETELGTRMHACAHTATTGARRQHETEICTRMHGLTQGGSKNIALKCTGSRNRMHARSIVPRSREQQETEKFWTSACVHERSKSIEKHVRKPVKRVLGLKKKSAPDHVQTI